MSNDALYQELKIEVQELVDALFGMSEMLLRKHGNFIPNGAVLRGDGAIAHVAVDPCKEDDLATSEEILPLLHEALRAEVTSNSVQAVGFAENVTVTRQGERSTDAIKVSLEHRRGLSIALYLPFEKRLFRGYKLGQIFWRHVDPEVAAFALSSTDGR
jgi:hypothetical protein